MTTDRRLPPPPEALGTLAREDGALAIVADWRAGRLNFVRAGVTVFALTGEDLQLVAVASETCRGRFGFAAEERGKRCDRGRSGN